MAPENNGGARVLSYKALSNPGGFTSTVQRESSGKITVVGLQPGTKYTFTVLAANSVGASLASPSSIQMLAPTTASAPIIKSVVINGADDAHISFSPSDFDGGTPITEYEVVTHPYAAVTHTVTSAGIIKVIGLAPETEYSFTLIACNSAGDSVQSNISKVVRTPVRAPVPAPVTTPAPVLVPTGGGTPALTTQVISWVPGTSLTMAQSPHTPSTPASGTGSPAITYAVTSAGTTGCTVNASTAVITYTGAGSCTVTATAAATSVYASATKDVVFSIALVSRTLSIDSSSFTSTYTSNAAAPTLTSTSSGGTGAKTYTSSTVSVCSVHSSTGAVTFGAVGTCSISASIAADSTYSSANSSSVSFEITASTSTSITSFGFLNGSLVAGTVDNTAHTVAVTLPYGSATTRYPTFVLASGATAKVGVVAQVSGSTTNNYSSPVTYVITAQDNTTTQNYVVTLTIALNADATFTSFSFNALPTPVTEASGKVQISNIWNTVTVIFLPGTDRTNLVPTFTLATGATVKLGGVSQTSGVTANNYSSNLTYVVTAQNGTTTKTYTVKVGSAALSTSSKIKGQSPLALGTPSTTLASASGGSVSISSLQAADVSNAGSFVTSFMVIDSEDAVMRIVKYAAGADYTGFETDTVYANVAITDGDFFIVKVKSVSTITVMYYKITVTVTV